MQLEHHVNHDCAQAKLGKIKRGHVFRFKLRRLHKLETLMKEQFLNLKNATLWVELMNTNTAYILVHLHLNLST